MGNLTEILSTFSDVISFLANICVLGITVYTLYLTAFCKKLSFVSSGVKKTSFYGDTLFINLSNKSLHAIPITEVFIMKKIDQVFYKISFGRYDDPILIEPWNIRRIETEPFTRALSNLDQDIELFEMSHDIMVAVKIGQELIWIKPSKNAPCKLAKKAYKDRKFDIAEDNIQVIKISPSFL